MVYDQNVVQVFSNDKLVGKAAGMAIENCILDLQKNKQDVRMIFAAAPSQNTMLDYLSKSTKINWSRVTAFHMDEYLGLPIRSPKLFSSYLDRMLFSKVKMKESFFIQPNGNIENEISRYTSLVNQAPIDIVCLGIGENGHIAFNDPPTADFNDTETMREVLLDEECRRQQVNDKCFAKIDDVPTKALTLTVPAIMKGKYLFCVALGSQKSTAVKEALMDRITSKCPASVLRKHANCKYFFDEDAYEKVTIQSSQIVNE